MSHFAFVDRSCPYCGGAGCEHCFHNGIVGSYEEVPDREPQHQTEFGRRLFEERVRRDVSYWELAMILEMAPSRVCEVEQGWDEAMPHEIERIETWMRENA